MRRLLQTARLVPCATIRPDALDPLLQRTLSHLDRRDYSQADLLLSSLPAVQLDRVIWRLAKRGDAVRRGTAWEAAAPGSRHAGLLQGFAQIAQAWKLRGETYLSEIPERRRRRFPEVMARGYDILHDVAERDPSNAMAFTGLIHCSIIIGVGEEKRDRWFGHVMEVAPFHLPTLTEYLRGTKERWGGEAGQMLNFADWVTSNAPAGHMAHVIAADALVDKAFMVTDEEVDVLWLARGMSDDQLAAWISDALLRWLDATPETLEQRLGEVADAQASDDDLACLERFAMACFFAGAKPQARLLLAALGGRLRMEPWDYFIPYIPQLGRWLQPRQRLVRLTHDRICRELKLDPRAVVA